LVRALYRALIEAAKQVQRTALKDPDYEPPDAVPDVDNVLRPALLRIGEKVARLVVALPAGLRRDEVRAAAVDQLRTPHVAPESKRAIADAIAVLSNPPPPRAQ
jgi:hypothetical protein